PSAPGVGDSDASSSSGSCGPSNSCTAATSEGTLTRSPWMLVQSAPVTGLTQKDASSFEPFDATPIPMAPVLWPDTAHLSPERQSGRMRIVGSVCDDESGNGSHPYSSENGVAHSKSPSQSRFSASATLP